MFICIEGIDGAGKSTQAKLLAEYMKKTDRILLTSEPSNGKVGSMIRNLLKIEGGIDDRTMQLLFVADRSEHISKTIDPALEKGINVICDRYILSTLVYGSVAGLDKKWLIDINASFPLPDATIIIDINPKIALERIIEERKSRNNELFFERIEFLENANKRYKELATEDRNIYIVDGLRSKKEILQELIDIVNKL